MAFFKKFVLLLFVCSVFLTSCGDSSSMNVVSLSSLHVRGNKIVDSKGVIVTLHGVNRSGSEYMCNKAGSTFDGSVDEQAIDAMLAWKINVVRIPLNESCWLGLGHASVDAAQYKQEIQDYVTRLIAKKLYPILDLHWNVSGDQLPVTQSDVPDANSVVFWSSVAQMFKGTPAIFDLFNEPKISSWRCWRDGGSNCGVSAVGMQSLVTAVRRIGANNLILLGGTTFASTIDKWVTYKPIDPANNIAISWHLYGGPGTCLTTACLNERSKNVIGKFPIVVTEFGESFDGSLCTTTNDQTVISWLEKNKLGGYLAWTWNTPPAGTSCGGLFLITDYETGNPRNPFGKWYKNYLKHKDK